MKKVDVIEFYGGVRATAKALGLGASTVSQWAEDLPVSRQDHVRLAMEAEQKIRDEEARKEAKRLARKGKSTGGKAA